MATDRKATAGGLPRPDRSPTTKVPRDMGADRLDRREFIPTYVISLADAEARRRNMTARLMAAGVPFRFFDAVDGRARGLPDVIDGARVVRTLFQTEAGLACTASHRLLYR